MHQTSPRRPFAGILLLLFLIGSLAGSLLAESYRGKTVTVYRKDLPPITGLVIEHVEGKSIKLQVGAGSVVVSLEEAGVRVQVIKSVKEQFEEQAAKCKTADDWVKLAKWCAKPEVNLPEERKRSLDEAVKLEKDHSEARKLRGDVKKDDGTWVNEEEEKKAQGFVKTPDGKYISKKAADKLAADKKRIASGLGKRELEMEGVPWASTKVLTSKHYILKCNSTPEVAARYLNVLERYYSAYSEVLKGFEPLYTDPSVVYVFRNREEFMDFTMVGRGVGGYFSPIDRSVRTYHGSFALTGNTDMILAHESTHQFQHRIMKDMRAAPYWIIEAMATYFGDGSKFKQGKVQLHTIARDRLQSLQDAIDGGYYCKIRDLLHIRQGGNIMPAYDHGWGLIYWLLNGSKYKVPPKGDGRKIWDQYLRHVTLDLKQPTDLDKETKVLTDLILKESRDQKDAPYPTIEKWEEDYKNFLLSLRLDSLGKWTTGSKWDGFKEIGIQFTAPDKMKKVEDKDLRQSYREAAAAITDDGLRLWLSVYDNPEIAPAELLQSMINGLFAEKEFDEEFRDEEVKVITVSSIFDVAVSKFKGKFTRRRESAVQQGGSGEKAAKGAEKTAKKASTGGRPKANLPDPTVMNNVRVALFSTMDRVYLFCLAGPEMPFSKMEPKFDDVLNSVKLNFELH